MKALLSALVLLMSTQAFAGQLVYDKNDEPVCYVGNARTALEELMAIDCDPALSGGRILHGGIDGAPLLWAKQIDENGELLRKLVIPPCN